MNLLDAEEILELPKKYTESDIKQNYRRLAMKYHPDKNTTNPNSEQFIKIQQAYEFINKDNLYSNQDSYEINKSFDINSILKNVMNSFKFKVDNKIKIKVKITIQEYFTGISKQIKVTKNCFCKGDLCLNCAGCGYNITNMSVCMECTGDGYNRNCNCFDLIDINLPKCPKQSKFEILISDDNYFFDSDRICYNFKISLKDSLIGFEKTFKDPFDTLHSISVNQIIKNGDGYNIIVNGEPLILVFNVIYPKKLSLKVKKILANIDF